MRVYCNDCGLEFNTEEVYPCPECYSHNVREIKTYLPEPPAEVIVNL